MKLSKYTIMFTENENGKTILFNTLTGAVFKLNEEYKKIIEEKYKNFDNNKIDIDNNPILGRITYIVFPIWELDELLKEFQKQL